jgi:nucleotide-binding universal stress UspA family protein
MKSSVSPGSVVVGVDGSNGSDTAVVWAATYAAGHRRPLTIVHGTGAPVVTAAVVDLHEARHSLRIAGRRVTDHALGLALAAAPGLDVGVHVDLCEPRSLLAEAAVDAHLLVLGSRGHGAVLSLLLGSVSVALAAHAPCAVVVVRPAAEDDDRRPVVVGADGTVDSHDALTFAFELASEQHRTLEVVHAIGEAWLFPAPDASVLQMGEEVLSDWKLLLAESVAGYAEKFPDVTFTSRVVQGSAAAALVAAGDRASTVVVGARGRSAMAKRLLGSVSRSVVEHAPCTVAVVRGARP